MDGRLPRYHPSSSSPADFTDASPAAARPPPTCSRRAGHREQGTPRQWYNAATTTRSALHRRTRLWSPLERHSGDVESSSVTSVESSPPAVGNSLAERCDGSAALLSAQAERVDVGLVALRGVDGVLPTSLDNYDVELSTAASCYAVSEFRARISASCYSGGPSLSNSSPSDVGNPSSFRIETPASSIVLSVPKKRAISFSIASDGPSTAVSRQPDHRKVRKVVDGDGDMHPTSCRVAMFPLENTESDLSVCDVGSNAIFSSICRKPTRSRISSDSRQKNDSRVAYPEINDHSPESILGSLRKQLNNSDVNHFNTKRTLTNSSDESFELKHSCHAKESLLHATDSVFYQHKQACDGNQGLSMYSISTTSNSSQDILPHSSSQMYPVLHRCVGSNFQYGYEDSHDLTSAFNLSTSQRGSSCLCNSASAFSPNLPHEDCNVSFMLHPNKTSTYCRNYLETKFQGITTSEHNENHGLPATLNPPCAFSPQSTANLILHGASTSNLLPPCHPSSCLNSVDLPTSEVPHIMDQSSQKRYTSSLNLHKPSSSDYLVNSDFPQEKSSVLCGSSLNHLRSSVNPEMAINASPSQSLSTASYTESWSTLNYKEDDAASISRKSDVLSENSLHKERVQSANLKPHNVKFESSKHCMFKLQKKTESVCATNAFTKIGDDVYGSREVFNVHQPIHSDESSMHKRSRNSNDTVQTQSETSRRRCRRRAIGLVCGVCGDSARSLHFGGVSCDSCKAFFRRAVIAKAYPSFLCVTTGLPPRTKCLSREQNRNLYKKSGGHLETVSKSREDLFRSGSNEIKGPNLEAAHHSTPDSASTPNSAARFGNQALSYNFSSTLPKISSQKVDFRFLNSESSQHSSTIKENIEINNERILLHKPVVSDVSSSSGNHNIIARGNVKQKERNCGSPKLTSGMKKCPPITITTRKYCQACRFQQCVDIGMEISWVTLENDAQRKMADGISRADTTGEDSRGYSTSKQEYTYKTKEFHGRRHEDDKDMGVIGDDDPNQYLTKVEQRQIEDLVDVYRSVFWGVPEPLYHRPALIDFPPAFQTENKRSNKNRKKTVNQPIGLFVSHSAGQVQMSEKETQNKDDLLSKEHFQPISGSVNLPNLFQNEINNTGNIQSVDSQPTEHSDYFHHLPIDFNKSVDQCKVVEDSCVENESLKISIDDRDSNYSDIKNPSNTLELEFPLSNTAIENLRSLPNDPLGVNMLRKALIRRPRPWLIRQLMGYTLRFMNVVLKILQSVGRSLSTADRTILLRQGMTGLTFMNSVFTYDSSSEGWPERVFPPLPLVLQEGESGSISDQPDYLQGIPMHADEVASVVAPDVLEHQLVFIRGLKTLIGTDYPPMFLLMAIMLFDPTQEGLEHPEVVEYIQDNYCHLLKKYVSWKFKNGPPSNPGDERPSNFSPLSSSSYKQSDLLNTGLYNSSDSSNEDSNRKITVYAFEIPEGSYFSPPYPPSPISPKAIFPLLLTKLADLQQVAHGYSSSPFLLQGSEVDEIANLVARIEVFMSDIIATGPGSSDRDEGDNGDSGGGNSGNSGYAEDNWEMNRSEVGGRMFSEGWKGNRSNKQPNNSDRSVKNKLFENNSMDWITSSGQDLTWESCSSGSEDTYSGSSLSGMSIGGSFNDIVGALITEDEGKIGINCNSGETSEQSLSIWEGVDTMKSVVERDDNTRGSEVEEFDVNKVKSCKNNSLLSEEDDASMEEGNGSNQRLDGKEAHLKQINSLSPPFFMLNSSSDGQSQCWIEECSNVYVNSSEQLEQSKKLDDDKNQFPTEIPHGEENGIVLEKNESLSAKGMIEGDSGHSHHNRVFEEMKKSSHEWCATIDDDNNIRGRIKETLNTGLWNRIKATGKTLLGLSSTQKDGCWKPGGESTQSMTLIEDERNLEHLLDLVERPESNSSGYVSTVSSPPPLNILKDFDPFCNGSDWEDIFQKL